MFALLLLFPLHSFMVIKGLLALFSPFLFSHHSGSTAIAGFTHGEDSVNS